VPPIVIVNNIIYKIDDYYYCKQINNLYYYCLSTHYVLLSLTAMMIQNLFYEEKQENLFISLLQAWVWFQSTLSSFYIILVQGQPKILLLLQKW